MPLKPPTLPGAARPGPAGADPAEHLPGLAPGEPWLDTLPNGLAWIDAHGRVLHANAAFRSLTTLGQAGGPGTLAEAPPAVQALLAWGEGGAWPPMNTTAQRAENAPLLERQGWLPTAAPGAAGTASTAGTTSACGCTVRARLHATRRGARPAERVTSGPVYVCTLESLQAADERDLASEQLQAVVRAAGIGIAAYARTPAGLMPVRTLRDAGTLPAPASLPAAPGTPPPPPEPWASPASGTAVRREAVSAPTREAFERIQQAVRQGLAASERYAIEHPELGRRWLLSEVQPTTTAHGLPACTISTQDLTDSEAARERLAQRDRELAGVIGSAPGGIAYLRGPRVAHCNARFERLLALPTGSAIGQNWHELLSPLPHAGNLISAALAALRSEADYTTEIAATRADGKPLHLRVALHRVTPAEAPEEHTEVVVRLANITQRKSQQVELAELGRERELMFDLSGVGIAFVRQGRVYRANAALARLLGYEEDQLPGRPWEELLPPLPDPAVAPAEPQPSARATLSEHEDWTRECQLRRADGTLAWFELSQRRVAPGRPGAGVILSCMNVDDRHRAERVVAEEAERTRTILDSVLVGIVTVSAGGIEWMNRSARRMFGGDLPDFLGLPVSTVATDEEDHPFRDVGYARLLAVGQAHTFECRVKARDGRTFWVVGNAVATYSNGRRQITYALLDIERRREAEARTAEAQASLQRIIEMAPLAISLRDAHTLRVLQMNQVAAAMCGAGRDQAVGRAPEELYTADVAAQMRTDMEAALKASAPTGREYTLEHDGQARVWDARYLPLAKPGLPPDQLLLVATDVTEQRAAAQAQLDAAIAQREMLVREVHHRIKNNLQGVAGLLQQIAANKPDVAPAISEVVGQVQAIAQVYGLQVGSSGPLKLRRVVEAIAQSVQRTYKRTISLRVEGESAHEWALPEAESIPIALCLNELLTNAVKHGSADDIGCEMLCDTEVHIEVHNPGRMPPGFSIDRVPGGVSGLGLVRALLPRRSARLQIEQRGERVVASLRLAPPGVTRLHTGIPSEPPGQQITLWPQ